MPQHTMARPLWYDQTTTTSPLHAWHSFSWIQSAEPGPHTHLCPSVSYHGLLLQGWHWPSLFQHLFPHGHASVVFNSSFFSSPLHAWHSFSWIQSAEPGPHTHLCPSVSYHGLLLQG